jgi:class 3 adenylate cyclase
MSDTERRLIAIFAADVEGYSRLMGLDEVGTLQSLTERRAVLDALIASHRGRIANLNGLDTTYLGYIGSYSQRLEILPDERLPEALFLWDHSSTHHLVGDCGPLAFRCQADHQAVSTPKLNIIGFSQLPRPNGSVGIVAANERSAVGDMPVFPHDESAIFAHFGDAKPGEVSH